MNRTEALSILDAALADYRARRHGELLYLLQEPDTSTVEGPSGATYQLEFLAVWDEQEGGNLRVFGHIDDGGLRAFVPLTRDFLVAPDGRFVDE